MSYLRQKMLPAISYAVEAAEQLGMNIRLIRTRNRMTQANVSESSEIERHHFSDIERGKVNVSLSTMVRIAKALSCSLEELVRGI